MKKKTFEADRYQMEGGEDAVMKFGPVDVKPKFSNQDHHIVELDTGSIKLSIYVSNSGEAINIFHPNKNGEQILTRITKNTTSIRRKCLSDFMTKEKYKIKRSKIKNK